jgi:hypothetical protein
VALMAEKNGSLTAAQAESILESTALPLPAGSRQVFDILTNQVVTVSWGDDATGAGLADAAAAVASLLVAKGVRPDAVRGVTTVTEKPGGETSIAMNG